MPEIKVDDLLFLLENDMRGEQVLNSILLVRAENEAVISVLNERNQMYISYLSKTEERNSMPKDQIEKVIGFRLFKRLELYTQRLIDITNNLIEDCDKAKKQINDYINQVG